MLIQGISVTLYERAQTGADALNAPVYTETPVTVENVLVQPLTGEDTDGNGPASLLGRKEIYQLAIPKGDTHTWENNRVKFFGKMCRITGGRKYGIERMLPLCWNAIYRAEVVDE